MGNYRIELARRVDAMLPGHVEFLSRVSIPAAKAFRKAYAEVIRDIAANPYQFPAETDPNLPDGVYRKALFAKRYKALFIVSEKTVFLDAVADRRQNTERIFRQPPKGEE